MDNCSPQITTLIKDPWFQLRQFTPARIALGRAGGSLPTQALLDFRMAHACARDAVYQEFDPDFLRGEITRLGLETVLLQTAVLDREMYLRRPDLGRRLNVESLALLKTTVDSIPPADLVVIISDGLSALAVHRQAIPLLEAFLPLVRQEGWSLSPIVVVRSGRVALQDEIGSVLGARAALILIGERPGLGAPDSLGAYLVYGPKVGNTDADRNCVSNIRREGLVYQAAAEKIRYLLHEAFDRKLSGVLLKDESADSSSFYLQKPS